MIFALSVWSTSCILGPGSLSVPLWRSTWSSSQLQYLSRNPLRHLNELRKHNNPFCSSVHGHNQKVLIWCPLGFCPLVSFCEENDALCFLVIHCPMNISVLQFIQQLLLTFELILLHPSAGHLHDILGSVVEVSFNWNVHLLWLASIAVTVVHQLNGCVSLLHLCNRSQRMVNYSWRSFHLTAASVVVLLSPFWSPLFHPGLQVCKKTCYQSWT